MPETQGSDSLPGILASIAGTKEVELRELRSRARELEDAADAAPPARDFKGALASPDRVALIAECKRRSPGAGAIRPDLDPVVLTGGYARAGAAALSVLTDTQYFGGSGKDLKDVREANPLPVLRKDFTLDPLHVVEARALGADAVLLIVRILSDTMLARLHAQSNALGMAALVEVHDRRELERAVAVGADLIGINNRDLSTFRTDLETTLELIDDVPDGALIVSESGIREPADVLRLGEAGVDAVLVGESLLKASDPEEAARRLSAVPRTERIRG
ncbi:MAG: indole-3-glycerol phosphate synthase TrpC [Gemmatimonadota bacterium]|nr:indole-3-glycerol phosphate synthase TrpC [Gemmatimonadota bacterium]MDH3423128.1 indole-3-glycerol phosphate synthase TrpC [Gemmatimonadota bacterium]